MSSLFSCLGKKSKAKKKKNGKPPEAKVKEAPKEEDNKDRSIEEVIPTDKVNGHVDAEEDEGKESTAIECEEDSQQVTLIKELKSKLSIKAAKVQNEANEEEKIPDESKLAESKNEPKLELEQPPEGNIECTEVIEKSVIQSVEAEIVKIESKAKEKETKPLSKFENIAETNMKQTNHLLSEQNQNLKKTCNENEKQISKQKEEISQLQKECTDLKATISSFDKLMDAIKERKEIMTVVEQLTDVCSSLKLRLDEIENEKDVKKSTVTIESKINSIDTDHQEINETVHNALRCVQELECRVINLELDKASDKEKSGEILTDFKDMESCKLKLQEELNVSVNQSTEQLNRINSLESQIITLTTKIADLQLENKNVKDLLDDNTKSSRVKDEKIIAMKNAENSLQNTIRNLEAKIENYEARHKSESDEIANLKKKLEKFEIQLREKEIAHQETIRKLAEAQNKQEDLQKRLSVVATEKEITNHLPVELHNADDSPERIGERFRDLYRTVWCEAYDKLHTVCKRDERKVLLILMEYLTECYLYSRRTARHQMDALMSLLVSPTNMRGSLNKRIHGKNTQIDNIPASLRRNIMTFRRTPSESFTESIFEEFMNQVDYQKSRHLRNIQARDITEVTPFVQKCIGVCWEMVTQEPPMYLLFKLRHNQIIEKDKFDIYNGDGNKVDFLVWPALLRDENGPLLQKGVVQAVRL